MSLDRTDGRGRILTGCRARLTVAGKKIGFARGVTVSEGVEWTPIKVLDSIETVEHVPVNDDISFTASMFRIVGSTLKSEGLMASCGANSEEHLQNILLTSSIMNAIIEDTKTGKVVCEIVDVKVASHNWTIDAGGVVGEDVEFVGVRVMDESELA
jgi:hypothetical protein